MKPSTVLYPIFLSLHGRRCAVAGIGSVGCRKLSGLLASDASEILALDKLPLHDLSSQAQTLLADSRVIFECRRFAATDALTCDIVIAATSDCDENLRIARMCEKHRTWCNSITDPDAGDFIVPAVARKGPLTVALSTSGQSPALAGRWRRELEAWVAPRATAAHILGRLREPVLALGLDSDENRAILRKLADSPIPDWLEKGDMAKCKIWAHKELPENLASAIARVLEEYGNVFC